MSGYASHDLEQYLWDLSDQLSSNGEHATMLLFGGGVMALEYNARPATRDLDAKFIENGGALRLNLQKTSSIFDIDDDWLNEDGQKFVTPQIIKASHTFKELPGMTILTPPPEAVLAMKVLSMRIGPSHQDASDIIFLMKYIHVYDRDKILEYVDVYMPNFRNNIDDLKISLLESLISKAIKE